MQSRQVDFDLCQALILITPDNSFEVSFSNTSEAHCAVILYKLTKTKRKEETSDSSELTADETLISVCITPPWGS